MANAAPAQSATAIEKPKKSTMEMLKEGFQAWRPTLQAILPKHIDPDRVIKISINLYLQKPDLQRCTWRSMIRATMQCAELGLDPSPLLGEAHFIPYENTIRVKDGNQWVDRKALEVTLQPGYAGLTKLAKQTGLVSDIYAVCVDESEATPVFNKEGNFVGGFYVEQGTVRKIHHIQNFGPTRTGKVHAAYGVVKMADGSDPHFEVFSRADLDRIRAKSQAYRANPDTSPWTTDHEAMCRKTMIKQVVKYVPKSPEKPNLANAIAIDTNAEIGEKAFTTELAADLLGEDTTGEDPSTTTVQPDAQPAQLTQGAQTQVLLGKLGNVAHDADGVVVEGRRR